MKLTRGILTLLQTLAVVGPIAGGGAAQLEGTSNTQDFWLLLAGLVVSMVSVALNRSGTTPITDPSVPKGTVVNTYTV